MPHILAKHIALQLYSKKNMFLHIQESWFCCAISFSFLCLHPVSFISWCYTWFWSNSNILWRLIGNPYKDPWQNTYCSSTLKTYLCHDIASNSNESNIYFICKPCVLEYFTVLFFFYTFLSTMVHMYVNVCFKICLCIQICYYRYMFII